ncbi:MAG: hypothetical protein ABEN55_21715 [Bradymonadaceae bacterium]
MTLISGTGGKLWQISASAKQIWDPSATNFAAGPDSDGDGILEAGNEVSPTNYTIYYHFGLVEFSSDRSGQTILANGTYLPHYQVPMGTTVELSTSYNTHELPIFFNSAIKNVLGLGDLEATLGHFDVENLPLDGSGGSEDTLKDVFGEARRFVLEVGPEGTTNDQPGGPRAGLYKRAWCRFSEESLGVSLGEAVQTELSMVPSRQPAAMSTQDSQLWDTFDFG